MEKFLIFWSRHNVLVIEVLIGLILLTVVYLAFRTFFGKDEEHGSSGTLGGADLGQIEQSLKKILEGQNATGLASAAAAPAAAPAAETTAAAPAAGASAAGSPEEIAKLKAEIAEKDKLLAELKAQQAAAPAAGASSEETKAFEAKIKDLEARLAEYEIISEDIADLSFYKEENGKLQKELEAMKASGGGGGGIKGATVAPVSDDEAAVFAEAAAALEIGGPISALGNSEPAAEPVAAAPAATPTPEPPPALDPLAEAEAALAASAAPVSQVATEEAAAATALATDPVLKEMAESAATETAKPVEGDDSQLMNQFENFVKKG